MQNVAIECFDYNSPNSMCIEVVDLSVIIDECKKQFHRGYKFILKLRGGNNLLTVIGPDEKTHKELLEKSAQAPAFDKIAGGGKLDCHLNRHNADELEFHFIGSSHKYGAIISELQNEETENAVMEFLKSILNQSIYVDWPRFYAETPD